MNIGFVVYVQTEYGRCGYLSKTPIGNKIEDLKANIIDGMNDNVRIFPTLDAARARIETLENDFGDYIEYTCVMHYDGQTLASIENL